MHDCLCCENFSTILSISDMKSIPGFIKYGHIFFSIHPMYLSSAQRETVLDDSTMKNPVDLSCKMASSINDLFIGNGAALATTRPPSSTLKKGVKHQPLAMIKNIKMCQSVLNIESCTMRYFEIFVCKTLFSLIPSNTHTRILIANLGALDVLIIWVMHELPTKPKIPTRI